MDLQRAVRILSAAFVLMGLAAIAAPVSVADLFGLTFQQGTEIGYGEIGALYGGNFVGLGLIGLYATRSQFDEGPLLVAAIGVVWLCIAAGRLVVMFTHMAVAASAFGWLSVLFEAAVGAVFVLAARSRSRIL
jgi:hypothetical protein